MGRGGGYGEGQRRVRGRVEEAGRRGKRRARARPPTAAARARSRRRRRRKLGPGPRALTRACPMRGPGEDGRIGQHPAAKVVGSHARDALRARARGGRTQRRPPLLLAPHALPPTCARAPRRRPGRPRINGDQGTRCAGVRSRRTGVGARGRAAREEAGEGGAADEPGFSFGGEGEEEQSSQSLLEGGGGSPVLFARASTKKRKQLSASNYRACCIDTSVVVAQAAGFGNQGFGGRRRGREGEGREGGKTRHRHWPRGSSRDCRSDR